MTARDVRRFVEDLLRGRRTRAFRPDDEDAEQMRAAITLRAARPGGGAPSEEFVADLHRASRRSSARTRSGRRAAPDAGCCSSARSRPQRWPSGRSPTA